jgi:hypothetical protein
VSRGGNAASIYSSVTPYFPPRGVKGGKGGKAIGEKPGNDEKGEKPPPPPLPRPPPGDDAGAGGLPVPVGTGPDDPAPAAPGLLGELAPVGDPEGTPGPEEVVRGRLQVPRILCRQCKVEARVNGSLVRNGGTGNYQQEEHNKSSTH